MLEKDCFEFTYENQLVQLLPVQLEIRFIYIYAFLIPTLFLFQFLKFTEYQAVHT